MLYSFANSPSSALDISSNFISSSLTMTTLPMPDLWTGGADDVKKDGSIFRTDF